MRRAIIPLILLAALSGCAQVRPENDFGKVSDIAQERHGQRPLWVRSPEDEAFAAAEVKAILARGVTQADAVRLALINNPGVQARFEEIGVARADVVQAGLPRNPSLAVLFGFPLFTGGPLGALAGQAMVSISDLAEVRDRTAKAQAELERDILIVGREAMAAARDARLAWLETAYAARARSLAAGVAEQADRLVGAARKYRGYGLADDARVAALEASSARAALEVSGLASREAVAKARLARVMGLAKGEAFAIAGDLPDATAPLPEAEAAAVFALKNNLDVQAAGFALNAARSGRELEKVRWLKEFEVGGAYDYDIESNRTLGPGASVLLPLFDQNRAQRAKAAFLERRAARMLEEARSAAREEALRALEDAALARATAESLASGVLPPAARAAKWAAKYSGAMQLSELDALETQLALLQARLEHNKALHEEQAALVRLEYALGGPIAAK